MAKFASVRTAYYKDTAARAVLDHAHSKRNGFTRSSNVHNEFSMHNIGRYLSTKSSCLEAYESIRDKHTKRKGKRPRSDMNCLFEHVVILSVEQYEALEIEFGAAEAKRKTLQQLADYSKQISANFGFTQLGFDLHLDEGHRNSDGSITRNIHAHVMFYNYDFKNDVAPLRGLMAKGKTEQRKTRELNPNFCKMQDLVAASFAPLGFERGISNGVDNRKNEKKNAWIKTSIENGENQLLKINERLIIGKQRIAENNANADLSISELKKLQNQVDKYQSEYDQIKLKYSAAKTKLDSIDTLVDNAQKTAFKPFVASLLALSNVIDKDTLHAHLLAIKHYDNHRKDLPRSVMLKTDEIVDQFRPQLR